MDKKICTSCKEEKNIDLFGTVTRKHKTGNVKCPKAHCKKCETEIQRTRRNLEKKEDPEKYHKRWADYYAKTKEHNYEMKKNFLSIPENRKARNEYIRKYKAKKRETDPSFKLYENHRKRIWKCLKNKSNSSKDLLGCDITNYVKWIEYTMDEQMNWENYGTYWNIDHLIPIDTFDITCEKEAKKAFNWKNTWAMVSSKNFSKNSNIIEQQVKQHNTLLKKYCTVHGIVMD